MNTVHRMNFPATPSDLLASGNRSRVAVDDDSVVLIFHPQIPTPGFS